MFFMMHMVARLRNASIDGSYLETMTLSICFHHVYIFSSCAPGYDNESGPQELNVSTSGDGVDGGDPGENQPLIKERERIEIYDFDEAVGRGILTKQPSAQKSQFLQRRPITWLSDLVHIVHHYRYLETGPAQSVDNYIDLSMSDIPDDHSVPNVSLNVSGQRTSEGELWMIAVVSILPVRGHCVRRL
jgi:hypothetical protein